MKSALKHSPLCSRDDGNELFFTVKKDASKYRIVVPREVLDDECGNSASEVVRKAWAKSNMPLLLSAVTDGGFVKAPFNRILVEEIS